MTKWYEYKPTKDYKKMEKMRQKRFKRNQKITEDLLKQKIKEKKIMLRGY